MSFIQETLHSYSSPETRRYGRSGEGPLPKFNKDGDILPDNLEVTEVD